jgi:hypothetical protein
LALALALAAALAAGAPGASAQERPESCPDVLLATEVVEGAFEDLECGDLCHLWIKMPDQTVRELLAGGDVQDFEGPPGAKVRVTVETSQLYDHYEGCATEEVAVAIERAD